MPIEYQVVSNGENPLKYYPKTIKIEDLEKDVSNEGNGQIIKDVCKFLLDYFKENPQSCIEMSHSANTSKLLNLHTKSDKFYHRFPKFSEKYDLWRVHRESTIQALESYEKQLDEDSRLSNRNRIIFSSLDFFSLVGGCILKRSESKLASTVLQASAVFGILGGISNHYSIKKTRESNSTIKKNIKKKIDQEELVLRDIRNFLNEAQELEEAWLDVIPQEEHLDFLKQLDHDAESTDTKLVLFEELFKAYAKTDPTIIKDPDLLLRVFDFATSPESYASCNLIGSYMREKKVIFDILYVVSSRLQLMESESHELEKNPSHDYWLAVFWKPQHTLLLIARMCYVAFSLCSEISERFRGIKSLLSQHVGQTREELKIQLEISTAKHDQFRSYYENSSHGRMSISCIPS